MCNYRIGLALKFEIEQPITALLPFQLAQVVVVS